MLYWPKVKLCTASSIYQQLTVMIHRNLKKRMVNNSIVVRQLFGGKYIYGKTASVGNRYGSSIVGYILCYEVTDICRSRQFSTPWLDIFYRGHQSTFSAPLVGA